MPDIPIIILLFVYYATYCQHYLFDRSNISVYIVGNINLNFELNSLSGDNIYSDYLARHGEGIDHLQFTVENVDHTSKIMDEAGFATIMGGRFSDGGFAYYDTSESLKCIWKALQVPKTMPDMSRYPR